MYYRNMWAPARHREGMSKATELSLNEKLTWCYLGYCGLEKLRPVPTPLSLKATIKI